MHRRAALALIASAMAFPSAVAGEPPAEPVSPAFERLGGTRIVFQVDAAALRKQRLETLRDDVRRLLTTAPRIRYNGLAIRGDGVEVRITDHEARDEARRRLALLNESLSPLTVDLTEIKLGAEWTKTEPTAAWIEPASLSPLPPGLATLQEPEPGFLRLVVTERLHARDVFLAQQNAMMELEFRIKGIFGTSEFLIAARGRDRILVLVPGVVDVSRFLHLIPSRSKVTLQPFAITADDGSGLEPTLPDDAAVSRGWITRAPYLLQKRVVSGVPDEVFAGLAGKEPVVRMRLDWRGSLALADLTMKQPNARLAVVLEDSVIAAARIRAPVPFGAVVQLSGLSVEEARNFALMLRFARPSAPLAVVEEEVRPPSQP